MRSSSGRRGRRATVARLLHLEHVGNLDSAALTAHRRFNIAPRSTIMSGRALMLASALAATLAALPAGSAGAASWLEMNFWLSGPRYEGVLPPCNHAERAATRSPRASPRRKAVLEFRPRNRRLRADPRDGVPALGAQHHPAPLLQRHRAGLGRAASTPIHYSIGEDTGMDRRRAGASNGAWSGSTATGPTTRPARWRGPDAAAPFQPIDGRRCRNVPASFPFCS